MIDPEDPHYRGKLWGTKDLKFWAGLSLILNRMEPESILEIGAGRSTTFFADYACSTSTNFVSIEENWEWHHKITDDLTCMCLPTNYIRHVPVKNGWYDISIFNSEVEDRIYDLVMIDGPVGDEARGHIHAMGRLAEICSNTPLVIVDDTHRPHAKAYLETIARGREIITASYMQRQYRYRPTQIAWVRNEISFIVSDSHTKIIKDALRTAGVI